jgi:hypothetical protein
MSIVTIDNASDKNLARAAILLAGIDGGIEKAMKNAMSRATSTLRNKTAQAIRERYAVSSGDAKSSPKISYSFADGVQAEILFAGKKISLSKFSGSSTSPGWSSEVDVFKTANGFIHGHPGLNGLGHVLNSTSPTALDDTFVANFRSGHAGIYERTGAETSTGADKITEKMGLSVPQMVGSDEIEEKLGTEAMEKFDERLRHEVERLLGG